MPNIRGTHVTITFIATDTPIRLTGDTVGDRWALRTISFQPNESNTGPVYIGMKSGMTPSDHGARLPIPEGGKPCAPRDYGNFKDGTMEAENFWVMGTQGDKVHIEILGTPTS